MPSVIDVPTRLGTLGRYDRDLGGSNSTDRGTIQYVSTLRLGPSLPNH